MDNLADFVSPIRVKLTDVNFVSKLLIFQLTNFHAYFVVSVLQYSHGTLEQCVFPTTKLMHYSLL